MLRIILLYCKLNVMLIYVYVISLFNCIVKLLDFLFIKKRFIFFICYLDKLLMNYILFIFYKNNSFNIYLCY